MSRLVPLLAGLVVALATFGAVSLAGGSPDSRDDADSAPPPVTRAAEDPHRAGRAAFAAMGCGTCHRLAAAGSTGELGPPLDDRLAGHTAASLRATIVNPPASYMPQDFGERLSEQELDALVAFLLAARGR